MAFALRVDAHNSAAVELVGQAEDARDKGEVKLAIELCLEIRDSCFAADDEAVGRAKEMLAAFRSDMEIARRFRSRLKGTENWN